MSVELPAVDGVLSADEVAASAAWIASLQLPDGMIPWFPGGHCDPWNLVETAMALTVAGRVAEAEAAYAWLARMQRPDGAWHAYYLPGRVEDDKLDTNVCAYVATGVWHHWRCTGDEGFLAAMAPVVARAIDFVLSLQTPRGEILWATRPGGEPWPYALLTGCSSTVHSLRSAVALAQACGEERPDWELAAVRLAEVVAQRPDAFAPKDRWAMDWYYPVLAGVVTGPAARARLAERYARFVLPGRGVRCVDDADWVTAAETAECAIAHAAAGRHDTARELLALTRAHRRPDGSYLTGLAYPDAVAFPADETSAYTAAAVILAADALSGASPAADLFVPADRRPAEDLD